MIWMPIIVERIFTNTRSGLKKTKLLSTTLMYIGINTIWRVQVKGNVKVGTLVYPLTEFNQIYGTQVDPIKSNVHIRLKRNLKLMSDIIYEPNSILHH